MQLDVRRFSCVTSTMDLASEAAQRGAPEGLVIVADEQTAGRGRRGHAWSSPAGAGLYVSFVLRPPDCRISSLLTIAAGVAVRDTIARVTGLDTSLTWPNDVMVDRRKLAGVLAEGLNIGTPAQAVVLGIGINVLTAFYSGDAAARATSLQSELGHPVDRDALLDELLVTVAERYGQLQQGRADDILRSWRAAAPSAHGSAVSWDTPSGPVRGVTAGVDDSGALIIRTPGGLQRIISGEIRWE